MKALLLLMIAGLAGQLYLQWEISPQAAPARSAIGEKQPLTRDPDGGEAAPFTVPLGPAGDFDVIAARTLFSPDRRPIEQEAADVSVSSGAASLEGVDLRSVLITPEVSVAWVREQGGTEDIPLKPGEALRGWKVQRIERNALILGHGEEQATIDLRVFPEHAATPPPATKPAKIRNTMVPPQAVRKPAERRRPPSRRPGKEG